MNERIHRVLDGELSRDELTQEERAVLADHEATIAAAARITPPYVAPDLTASIMARIAELDRPAAAELDRSVAPARANPLRRALDWLWTPRPIALRPAWALGAAVLAVGIFGSLAGPSPALKPAASPDANLRAAAAPAEIYVHFRLDAPNASSVHLAGDFTEWQPSYEMHESQPGVWTVIVPLEAGVHDYAFVIDGERWTPDPLATSVDDGFGGQNSRLSILPPERIQA